MPFLTRPPSEQIPKRRFWNKQYWYLLGKLVFKDANGEIWEVPAGYKHDYATIPRLFWPILPKRGNYDLPAVLHDFTGDDKLFYEAMVDEKVEPGWIRRVMYHAVALDGSGMEEYKKERANFGYDLLGD